MDEPTCEPQYLIDTAGLHELANTKSNSLRALCLDHLKNGVIAVPSNVWQEFQEIYKTEADGLAAYVSKKISIKRKYQIGAASIVEKANSGFPLSPHDRSADWYTAAICSIEKYTLVTTATQLKAYQLMGCCSVIELDTLDI